LDDRLNAVPPSQLRNLLVIARDDQADEEIVKPGSPASRVPVLPIGRVGAVQEARARFRMVRAVGLLDLARELTAAGKYDSIPSALSDLQWDGDGRFRSNIVNDRSVYERGMRLVQAAYDTMKGPHNVRHPGYFQFAPYGWKDCGDAFTQASHDPAFPWDLI